MVQYNKIVLDKLLDIYESSLLSTGDNVRNIKIELRFSKKNLPAYFDESSLEYESIHILMKELEDKELIRVVWKGNKPGHVIEKVQLNIDNIQHAYLYLKRVPKSEWERLQIKKISEHMDKVVTPVCRSFAKYLLECLKQHKSVKEFIHLDDWEETIRLLEIMQHIENNNRQLYLREFSIMVLKDSKAFEHLGGKIAGIFKRFKQGCENRELAEILADYNIYHTPNYVYLKGDVTIFIGEERIDLSSMKQGIGISGEDIGRVKFGSMEEIQKVITIENLTTFFRWCEKNSLIVYLGGYHNSVRRLLLKEIYSNIPEKSYYHFGDIDAWGFEIYRDLCEKTGISFTMYHMDLETLKQYERYGKKLTGNDRKRLENMERQEGLADVIAYMLKNNVKLEQECILCERE